MSEEESRPVYRTVRELADDDRPRERLLRHGPEYLSDGELLAIVLGSGLPGTNVIDLARGLLEQAGGLAGLLRLDVRALQRTRGLGPAKAAQITAAVELSRRLRESAPEDRPRLLSPEAVYAFAGNRFFGKTREELLVISLDTKGRFIGESITSHGSVNGAAVRAAEVFREAMVLDATSVVLVHNHPSGDARPSQPDIVVTRELVAAGELLGIEVFDHLVVGQNRWVSMRKERLGFERAGGEVRS